MFNVGKGNTRGELRGGKGKKGKKGKKGEKKAPDQPVVTGGKKGGKKK